jgi:hypothetical protein
MFQALEPFHKDVVVDEPRKDTAIAVKKFFGCLQKYQYNQPLKDLCVLGRTIEEFWETVTKIKRNLSMESRLCDIPPLSKDGQS